MEIVLVPVIMVCALGGTIGLLKLIQKVVPNSTRTKERADEWIEQHR